MEEVKSVQADSLPATEQVVNEAENTATESSTTQETTDGSSGVPASNTGIAAVDEFGVPWINRAKEQERKFNELVEKFPTMVEEVLTKKSSAEQNPTYTVSQLEAYALEHPEYRPWVEEQKEKIRTEQIAKTIEERIGGEKRKTEAELKRQQAYAQVAQNNPELFVVQNGTKVWNTQSPVVQLIGQIMADPRIANEPEGIAIATDIAYGRYLRSQASKANAKVQNLDSALKKEQRKSMVEGGGNTSVVDKSPVQSALDNLKNKRNKSAAQDAIKEIFKAQGVLK